MTTDDPDGRMDVRRGTDTDHDGIPDTLLVPGRPELMLAVDIDRDALADLVIEIGPDAVVRRFRLVPGTTDPFAEACYPDDPDTYPDTHPDTHLGAHD